MTSVKPTSPSTAAHCGTDVQIRARMQQMEIVRKLVAAMMLGQRLGMPHEVTPIYQALSQILQSERMLDVGLAIASASAGNVAPAWALITEALLTEPEADMAVLAMALALKKAGDPDWRSIIEDAFDESSDSAVRQFVGLIESDHAAGSDSRQMSLLQTEDAA